MRKYTRGRLDVGIERSVEPLVVGGVIAHDIDDRGVRAPGVVQVGHPIAQPAAQMQQRRGRLIRHPAVAVGGSGHDALEQAQHGTHLGHAVQRCDEMHLRSAGIAEAHLHATVCECADQGLRAVHRHVVFPSRQLWW